MQPVLFEKCVYFLAGGGYHKRVTPKKQPKPAGVEAIIRGAAGDDSGYGKESNHTMLQVLVIDDETNIRKTLSYCLNAEGHCVTAVSNPGDAVMEARQTAFDMVFLDLRLGGEDGMALIPVLLSESPWTKIVMITAHASVESAVDAMKKGAVDYIAKPFTPDQIRAITRRIARIRELEVENTALREDMRRLGPESRMESKNPSMQRVIEMAKKVAPSEATVLIRGESGTGKSVLARAIHRWSPRAGKPMSIVSCPAVPQDLFESELFGHAKGAFTGAVRDNPGRIAACTGGTLFLDEIGEMAPSAQAKVLRFIQDREYERVGESLPRKADVRFIAATNADLEKRVAEGRFREDLFHRLNVISLTIPPLRSRPEDIMPLAMDYLAHFRRANRKTVLGFTKEAEQSMMNHSWPGNVRELCNAVERAVILGNGERIEKTDLPEHLAPASGIPAIGDRIPLSVIEEWHIRKIMAGTGSLQEAAEVLGIDQATLWRRRKLYGI